MPRQEDLTQEITSHFMNPKNYGELFDADGVGIGKDNATKAYVIMYINHDNKTINEVRFATSGSQDTITLGSMLCEMIEGDSIENVLLGVTQLEKDLQDAYALVEKPEIDMSKPEAQRVKAISTEQQDSANMVLTAFRAAMRHIERKQEGIEEKQFAMNIAKICPYSSTDCHFMMENQD
ncbi:MAG: iron-sulfur cluster assembly scaffold protein [Campylobacterota bacterium]|nr:iron-sulfur cluster assembly scaffold protein [Campylobacterota bacterium]